MNLLQKHNNLKKIKHQHQEDNKEENLYLLTQQPLIKMTIHLKNLKILSHLQNQLQETQAHITIIEHK